MTYESVLVPLSGEGPAEYLRRALRERGLTQRKLVEIVSRLADSGTGRVTQPFVANLLAGSFRRSLHGRDEGDRRYHAVAVAAGMDPDAYVRMVVAAQKGHASAASSASGWSAADACAADGYLRLVSLASSTVAGCAAVRSLAARVVSETALYAGDWADVARRAAAGDYSAAPVVRKILTHKWTPEGAALSPTIAFLALIAAFEGGAGGGHPAMLVRISRSIMGDPVDAAAVIDVRRRSRQLTAAVELARCGEAAALLIGLCEHFGVGEVDVSVPNLQALYRRNCAGNIFEREEHPAS